MLVLLTLIIAALAGCSRYTAKVPPPQAGAGPIEWKEYYEDQFKAYGDKVQPPSEDASLEQRVAYDDAHRSFKKKKAIGMTVSVVLLGCSALLLIGTLQQASEL